MRLATRFFTAVIFIAASASGQKVESYLHDLGESVVPFATATNSTCHAVKLDFNGPWSNFAIPSGVNAEKPSELKWAVLKVDVMRMYLNLSDLDEDKVQNHAIFSLEYISKHQKGTPYVPDTPAVMLYTSGLNKHITVQTVDLDKMDSLRGQNSVTESQMGLSLDERKYAVIPFVDQEHADAFQKAIQKAIVLCRAQ